MATSLADDLINRSELIAKGEETINGVKVQVQTLRTRYKEQYINVERIPGQRPVIVRGFAHLIVKTYNGKVVHFHGTDNEVNVKVDY